MPYRSIITGNDEVVEAFQFTYSRALKDNPEWFQELFGKREPPQVRLGLHSNPCGLANNYGGYELRIRQHWQGQDKTILETRIDDWDWLTWNAEEQEVRVWPADYFNMNFRLITGMSEI